MSAHYVDKKDISYIFTGAWKFASKKGKAMSAIKSW